MSKNKKIVFDTVKEILEQKPETRDNDMYLVAVFWYRDLSSRYNVIQASVTDFFHLMRNYKKYGLIHFETIRRQRCLIQELHAELRGKEYEKRHRKQAEVKADIKEIKADVVFGVNIHRASSNHPTSQSDNANIFEKPNENLLSGQQTLFGNDD